MVPWSYSPQCLSCHSSACNGWCSCSQPATVKASVIVQNEKTAEIRVTKMIYFTLAELYVMPLVVVISLPVLLLLCWEECLFVFHLMKAFSILDSLCFWCYEFSWVYRISVDAISIDVACLRVRWLSGTSLPGWSLSPEHSEWFSRCSSHFPIPFCSSVGGAVLDKDGFRITCVCVDADRIEIGIRH